MTFEYTAPRTYAEAVKALSGSPRARVLAATHRDQGVPRHVRPLGVCQRGVQERTI